MLGDVEHDRGDRLGPRVEDGLDRDVETPMLRRKPPERPESRDDRQDRPEQRRPNEELDDHQNESGEGELLRPNGALLEDKVVAAMHTRAVDEERSDKKPNDSEEENALSEQQDHGHESKVARMADYVVSSDARHVDRDLVWRFLHDEAYWSEGVPRDVVDRAIDGSICFSAFAGDPDHGAPQVAFARVVTDRATFAWVCDVFVLAEHRGKGVATRLMDAVMSHPDLQGLRNVMLATRDAHRLYARYGFAPLADPARWMAIRRPYRP